MWELKSQEFRLLHRLGSRRLYMFRLRFQPMLLQARHHLETLGRRALSARRRWRWPSAPAASTAYEAQVLSRLNALRLASGSPPLDSLYAPDPGRGLYQAWEDVGARLRDAMIAVELEMSADQRQRLHHLQHSKQASS